MMKAIRKYRHNFAVAAWKLEEETGGNLSN
jgi:hypothetical protein